MGAFLEGLLGWGRALVGGSAGHVNLGGRGLEAVPGWVSLYRDATGLSLDGNRLRALPPSLGVLRSLASLDIANNPFDEFPPVVFELAGLRRLNFSATMASLPDGFDALAGLEWVRIVNDDRLRTLPPSFGRLRSLRSLELCGQATIELPEHLAGLTALESLRLSRAAVGALPSFITRLPALKSLYLYNCDLTSLPDEIGDLFALEELVSLENPLEGLPETVARLGRLRKLVLRDAPLRTLPAGLAALGGLEALELDMKAPAEPEGLMAFLAAAPRCKLVGGTRPAFVHHVPGYVRRPNTRKSDFCFSYAASAALKHLCALLWIEHEDDLTTPVERRMPLPVASLPDWGAGGRGPDLIAAAFEAHPLALQLEPPPEALAPALDAMAPEAAARLALGTLWFSGLERVASAAMASAGGAPPGWVAPLCLAGAIGVNLATLPSAGQESGPFYKPERYGLEPAPPYDGYKNALHDGQPAEPALLEYDRTLQAYLRAVAAYLMRLPDGPHELLVAAAPPQPSTSADPLRERLCEIAVAALGRSAT